MKEIEAFADWLKEIPGIEEVRTNRPEYIDVWTIGNNLDEATAHRVCDLELRLAEQFPNTKFYFRLIDRRDKDLGLGDDWDIWPVQI